MRQEDWDDFRVFLALVRGGNVRSAAKELGVSHSTVARRIEQMEQSSGVQLFYRGKDGSTLTPAGEEIFSVAQRIEEDVHTLQRRVFGLDKGLTGSITLTIMEALVIEPVLEMLNGFRLQHPGIDLNLNVSISVARLDRREADIALRFGDTPEEILIGKRISSTARAVYASQEYIDRHWPGGGHSNAGWISYTPAGLAEDWKRQTPFADLPTHFRVSDVKAQQTAARVGMGLAYLPCFMCDTDPELVRLSDPDCPDHQALWLLRHPDTRNNARISALMSWLSKEFKELGPLLLGEVGETVKVK